MCIALHTFYNEYCLFDLLLWTQLLFKILLLSTSHSTEYILKYNNICSVTSWKLFVIKCRYWGVEL